MADALGDRMKAYERLETSERFDPAMPLYVRIDGRSFSKFTKGLERPYDPRLTNAMIMTTMKLVEQTHAVIGYTQSDEISLIYDVNTTRNSEMMFDGKKQKITSVLAGLASSAFMHSLFMCDLGERCERIPHFDCRAFSVPSQSEAVNALLWRVIDARKNAVSMASHHHFGHKAIEGKNGDEKIAMLAEKGIDFEAYPNFFKWGTFIKRQTVERTLTAAERERIPEKHRPAADQTVTRSQVNFLELPFFRDIANRIEVVFDGAEPVLKTDETDGAVREWHDIVSAPEDGCWVRSDEGDVAKGIITDGEWCYDSPFGDMKLPFTPEEWAPYDAAEVLFAAED